MQPVSAPRRDPSPSRMAYKAQRLWLTPGFRIAVRVGLPVGLLTLVFSVWFAQAANRQALAENFAELRRSIEERPEFMVRLMAIDGASDSLSDDIREIVPLDFPLSSFDIDLDGVRSRIAELDAVERVGVHVRSGGILQIEITERRPVVVWRSPAGLELLDGEGHRVAAIASRLDRTDLPLLLGEGAERAVPEALRLLAAAGPVHDRLRGLVRVGERRWDMVLDRDQRIMLPETDALLALEQVMALDVTSSLLDRDVLVVDMRNRERSILRVGTFAIEQNNKNNDL